MNKYILLIALFLISSCASDFAVKKQPVLYPAKSTKSYLLKSDYEVAKKKGVFGVGHKYTLKAGEYKPTLESDNGTYYQSNSKVVWTEMGIPKNYTGGFYIPKTNTEHYAIIIYPIHSESILFGGAISTVKAGESDTPIFAMVLPDSFKGEIQ